MQGSPYKGFTSSASRADDSKWPSEQKSLSLKLQDAKQNKWGWVIYRCTYDDDEGWARFKQIIQQRALECAATSDAPELADTLEWVFVEDRDTLDGASRHYLRSRFKAWAKDAIESEDPNSESFNAGSCNPRYSYFVQVDESSLKSVVYEAPQPPDHDLDGELGAIKQVARREPPDLRSFNRGRRDL
ncbi:hypothetical protein P170DRAFT_479102 [Aspergillus steynii IBT 23096]|uniref:Uncharacterized protein n=1 Tax=Aspergillus steynii IBT 23096 TaxID=1392250 RepID=A0A2I2FZY0_9EURO|nr:uncharacterized protein P170DRAFT_479102 [Aspergillus steynii IBT 23096]PLB46181.1 hypothetical protein P170DRAFT_479102 [Aspergillus steynii IBT 23096]